MKVLAITLLAIAVLAVDQSVDDKVTDLCKTMGYSLPSSSRKLLATPGSKTVKIMPSLIKKQDPPASDPDVPGPTRKTIIVGACPYPPYAYADKDKDEVDPTAPKGSPWTGFSVQLFEMVAKNLSIDIKYVNGTYDEHIKSMEAGKIDTIVSGIFYTKRIRESYPTWEFSHAFWQSGIAILVPAPQHPNAFFAVMSDKGMWSMVAALIFTLLGSGVIFWLLERQTDRPDDKENGVLDEHGRYNPDQIPAHWQPGLGMGIWLSSTTVTTVGYGDSFPKTWWGRSWAMFIMFASLFLVAAFTGAVTSAMTVSAVSGGGNGIDDINDVDGRNIGVLAGSFPDHYMSDNRKKAKLLRYPRMKFAVEALLAGKIDAVVGVSDVLQYQNAKNPGQTVMVGYPFRQHSIVWPFDDTSSNLKTSFGDNKKVAISFTEVLLKIEDQAGFDEVTQAYFG